METMKRKQKIAKLGNGSQQKFSSKVETVVVFLCRSWALMETIMKLVNGEGLLVCVELVPVHCFTNGSKCKANIDSDAAKTCKRRDKRVTV